MNFIETAYALKRIIDEMAYERKDAINQLVDMSYTFCLHICKIILWKNDKQNVDKWKKEINNYLKKVKGITIKGGKYLKPKDFENHLFYTRFENANEMDRFMSMIVGDLIEEGYTEPNFVSSNIAFSKYKIFVNSILNNTVDGSLTQQQVFEACDELIGE